MVKIVLDIREACPPNLTQPNKIYLTFPWSLIGKYRNKVLK
jgi:hypothetical protein